MAKLEDDFKKLEDIIERMEHEDLSLEDSFKAYEEGMRIVLSCNEQIDKVEKQLIILNEKNQENSYE
ncbi:MAG: exodeoxyribonuclease VII small subunit [Lachnospiraceae bacterium]|jgi:exonuclease VII small subunit